jgi:hypothetical protein
MAWVHRNGRRYYYRSKRIAGKVRRQYVGCGEEAELAAALDELRRARRRAERVERLRRLEHWQAAWQPLEMLIRQTDLLVEAALVASGFHRHHLGEWRKRREGSRGR